MSRCQLVQTAYIVDDLTTAVTDWRETSGIGPFFIMSNVRPQNGYYRGLPVELEMDIAFVQAGPMQIRTHPSAKLCSVGIWGGLCAEPPAFPSSVLLRGQPAGGAAAIREHRRTTSVHCQLRRVEICVV